MEVPRLLDRRRLRQPALDVVDREYVGWDESGQARELVPAGSGHVLVKGTGRDETQVLIGRLRRYVEKVCKHHARPVPELAEWTLRQLIDWMEAANRG